MTITFRERAEGYEDWREMFSPDGLFHALRADAITTAEEWHEARKGTYSGDEWNSEVAWNDWTAFYNAALEQRGYGGRHEVGQAVGPGRRSDSGVLGRSRD